MEKSSFFNSVNGDRKYNAEDFAAFFNSLITNGVFPNPATNLQVIANNNMTVTVKAGKAWINGYCYYNDSDLILPIDVADGVLKRIDRVIIQFHTANREIKAKIKKGTFASSPVAPSLQRDADIFELGIADISIINGATSITQANITDLRLNTTYCGIVNSLIQADTTAIFNQYQAWFTATTGQYNTDMATKEAQFQTDFTAWFNTVKDQLSGDVAGNLANQIATINSELADKAKQTDVDAINIKLTDYNSYASSADSNGIYTVVDYKRADGTLYMKSTLSGGTSPNYTTDTWKFYDTAGTTVILTKTWTITYDANGKITSKVVA